MVKTLVTSWWRGGWLLALSVMVFSGCGTNGARDDSQEASGIERTAQRGPVSMTLSATPEEIGLAETATLRVEIVADHSATVTPHSYERALGEDEHKFDYRIIRSRQEQAVPTKDGKLRWIYEYELEFVLAGDYELPGASLSFVAEQKEDQSAGEATMPPEMETVETDSIPIIVHEPAEPPVAPEELNTITALDPVELPKEWGPWWWIGPPLALALVLLIIVAIIRRVRRPEVVVPIPAHEWAQRQLAALVSENLLSRGFVKEFYYRVSDVVRGYVERRFDVSAPEMTTEEFLADIATDRRFGAGMAEELTRFLAACDWVKYAGFRPATTEAETLIATAGSFVERTRANGDGAGQSNTRTGGPAT